MAIATLLIQATTDQSKLKYRSSQEKDMVRFHQRYNLHTILLSKHLKSLTSFISKFFHVFDTHAGLHLVLDIGQDDYATALSDVAGARIVAHRQQDMPFPEDEGITVTPGMATFIGLKKVKQCNRTAIFFAWL